MEEGPIIINQGKPNSMYFKVFVPMTQPISYGSRVICRHPVSGVETVGTCTGLITERWIDLPEWICLDTYGMALKDVKEALENKIKGLEGEDFVRVVIIKQD